jgi:diadenosine tetraphosphate (Ap4A) HIT family hydrolase
MLNAYPYASGHVMVVPYRHIADLEELTADELGEVMVLARRAVTALRDTMAPHGFNIGLHLGAAAGAGVAEHLHLHVVPRWEGDTNFMPVIGNTRVVPEALDATRSSIAAALVGAPLSLMTFDLAGRSALADDGNLSSSGAFGNLPCGEAFISPGPARDTSQR